MIPSRFLERQTYDIPGGRHKLNPSQNRAVREALEKPLTVIQGPPGRAHAGGAAGCLGLPWATGTPGVGYNLLFSGCRYREDDRGPPHHILVS